MKVRGNKGKRYYTLRHRTQRRQSGNWRGAAQSKPGYFPLAEEQKNMKRIVLFVITNLAVTVSYTHLTLPTNREV